MQSDAAAKKSKKSEKSNAAVKSPSKPKGKTAAKPTPTPGVRPSNKRTKQ
jgi:hypothetical protein